MQIDARTVKKHFEKSMPNYDQNAVVQQISAEKIVEKLVNIRKSFSDVLELGSGTGLLTKEFCAKCTFSSFSANDLTERSKFYLDKILNDYQFFCGNAEKIKTNRTFDLIISNAMFQWFSDIKFELNNHLYSMLKDKGILAFSTFSSSNFKELRNITGLSLEYKSFDEIKQILSEKYIVLHAENFDYTMNFTTPLEVLAHMKHTGVNSLSVRKWTFSDVKDFCDKYKQLYPELTLTYSPMIFIVQK